MAHTTFAELTTMRVGGPVARLVEAVSEAELVEAVRELRAADEPWLLLGGGSNLIVGDDGFDGTVLRLASRGIQRRDAPDGVLLRVQAGEDWDALVALAVGEGWSGIEALSGIPGRVGAAPVQNIGAYGQELSDVLVAVDVLDPQTGELRRMPAAELELGYRTSVFKRGLAGVVAAVELRLAAASAPGSDGRRAAAPAPGEWTQIHCGESGQGGSAPTHRGDAALGAPIAYQQLADALGMPLGGRTPLAEVRRAVLALRAGKGMVLDPADPDSVSAGSFFTNPIVSESFARALPADAPRWSLATEEPDLVVPLVGEAPDGASSAELGLAVAAAVLDDAARDRSRRQSAEPRLVKLSAAWLIERAGIHRGFALPGSRAAISDKHTLAITNRGGAAASDVAQLARFVQGRVQAEFGVLLQPEPRLVGLEL